MFGDQHELSTSEVLLRRVNELEDRSAWSEFFSRYDPLLRDFGKALPYQNSADELISIVWDRLWRKMRTFEYDPGKKFRHWLWIFFRNQTLDYLKSKRRDRQIPVDFSSEDEEFLLPTWCDRIFEDDDNGEPISERASITSRDRLRAQAETVQLIVRSRVKNSTWQAFWLIHIEGYTIEEAGSVLGMTYLAAFKAAGRIAKMLEAEGKKLLGADPDDSPTSPKRQEGEFDA